MTAKNEQYIWISGSRKLSFSRLPKISLYTNNIRLDSLRWKWKDGNSRRFWKNLTRFLFDCSGKSWRKKWPWFRKISLELENIGWSIKQSCLIPKTIDGNIRTRATFKFAGIEFQRRFYELAILTKWNLESESMFSVPRKCIK